MGTIIKTHLTVGSMFKNKFLSWWHGVDFNRDSLEGQMTVAERKALFYLVRKFKPRQVFEIGTWKGGGNTYILSSALKKKWCWRTAHG